MREKSYTIYNTPEYDEWLDEQTAKSQVQVRSRIANIQDEGHFGEAEEDPHGERKNADPRAAPFFRLKVRPCAFHHQRRMV